MSYFDDEPPRHLDIGSLTKGENFSIYKSEKSRGKYKYHLFFSMEEQKALVKHGEKFVFVVHTNSKKVYKEAIKTQERARQYIENDKSSNKEPEIVK